MLGIAVDEGKITWDDPVTRHLPDLRLAVMSEDPKAECTLRDLLSHRHGFARMSMLWLSGALGRAEVLARAVHAEPLVEFRKEFHYSNVAYLAAGEAVAVAMGESWDNLVTERIFKPLGMSSSAVSLDQARRSESLALGYRWGEADQRSVVAPTVDLDSIAPAGAIYSTAEDMAKWIRFQLGRGEFEGKRLISEQSIETTWTPQISMGSANSYGLGWMIHEHRGKRVVEHGGAVDGFTAQVTLLPDEGIGYVLLMNLEVSPLREKTMALILDALLGEPAAPDESPTPDEAPIADAGPEPDLESYVGTYIANFAKFRDAKLEVKLVEDRLRLTIPGQGETWLKGPDEGGHWALEITDRISVSFRGDGVGPRAALVVHQGEFAFEVPREGEPAEPHPDPAALEPYLGTYRRDRGGKLVKLLVAKGRLVMEDKGNWVAFRAPDSEGHAPLRARSDHGATFVMDADGVCDSFIFRGQAGDQRFVRIEEGVDLPLRRELRALRRTKEWSKAMRAAGGMKSTGTVRMPQAGLEGTFISYSLGRDCSATHMDFGELGSQDEWTNGDAAWRHDPMRGTKALVGIELTQATLGHPAAVAGDWRRYFDSVSVVRKDELGGRVTYVVRLEKEGLPSRSYWVDAETGDVLQVKQTFVAMGQQIPVQTTFSDFRDVEGFRTAHRIVHENPATGRTVLVIETVESGLELEGDVFTAKEALGRQSVSTGKAPK